MELKARLQESLGGTYSIERELGGGGMSRVYVAEEPSLGRKVVIKVLPPEMAAHVSTERFKREIALAAQLQQANIVPLLSAGETDGLPYYTMPYVDGESLRARLSREGELPVGETIGILKEVARALAYAHQRGVVHRDIKPDNVLLSGGSAMVTDFGVAKAVYAARTIGSERDDGEAGLTSVGMAIGTPTYMSPEQATADPQTDHRADIYAFGVMAYEILTGHAPFEGRSAQALFAAHTTEMPESLARRRPNIPPPLAALVMRCLEKRPADRPRNANEIVQALDAIVTPTDPQRVAVHQTRLAFPIWAAIAVMITLVAVGVFIRTFATSHAPADKSIAVMPFTSLGGAAVDSFFLEGMSEEISGVLGKVPTLKVIGSTSVQAAKAKGLDDRALGKLVGASSLLQGSVQRAGDRIRIIAHLVNADNSVQLWSGTYNFDFKDIFAVQDTIAKAIAAELRASLGGEAPVARAATTNPEAHTLFLRGLYLWNRRTGKTLTAAISLFGEAAAKDTTYAEAYAYIGMGEVLRTTYTDTTEQESLARAEAAARRAIAMDSTLATPHCVLGWVYTGQYRNAEAEREYKRAIQLNPSFATAYQWYSQLLGHLGRGPEAVRQAMIAARLDPQEPVFRNALANRKYNNGQAAAADTTARSLLSDDPAFLQGQRTLALIVIEERKYTEADTLLRRLIDATDRNSFHVALRGTVLAVGGHPEQARPLLEELVDRSRTSHVSAGALAVLYDALGDREEAIRWLRRGVAEHDWTIRSFSHAPIFRHLRSDPRAEAALASTEQMR